MRTTPRLCRSFDKDGSSANENDEVLLVKVRVWLTVTVASVKAEPNVTDPERRVQTVNWKVRYQTVGTQSEMPRGGPTGCSSTKTVYRRTRS